MRSAHRSCDDPRGDRNVNKIATLAFGAIMLMCASLVRSDEVAAFATGGYASGLRTESMLDKKKTGKLDQSEYMAASAEVASFATGGYASSLLTPEMFKKIDTNGDGTISQREFFSYQLRIFDMMDTS